MILRFKLIWLDVYLFVKKVLDYFLVSLNLNTYITRYKFIVRIGSVYMYYST